MIFDFLFNFNEGLGVFIIGLIIGLILLYIANQLPRELGMQSTVRLFGFISILGSLGYWILISIFENFFELIKANQEITLAVVIVAVAGLIIFKDDLLPRKKRRK